MLIRIPVTIHGYPEKFLIVSTDENETIESLCQKALQRCSERYGNEFNDNFLNVRRFADRSLISLSDRIVDTLTDNESILIDLSKEIFDNDSSNRATNDDGKIVRLDGFHLKIDDLIRLGLGNSKIELAEASWKSIEEARSVVDEIIKEKKVVYGINTGFGLFADKIIPEDKLAELQTHLIVSHSVGVGEPLSIERARMMFALRINILAKGFSGISKETLKQIIDAFNESCVPEIPSQGTVGASGDLAPLAHLAAGLMGVGRMWSKKTGWADAKVVLEKNGLKPIEYKSKEGLTMINGTQFITALGAEGVQRAILLARQADVIAALSVEALRGTVRSLDPDVHRVRPHTGQNLVARRLRALLASPFYPSIISENHKNCGKVQDAYSIRCIPQVHGISWDTIKFAEKVISTEMNSATDNPLVFSKTKEVISGGNFHGEYPAKVLDYLAIAVHEIGSLSGCRMERLVDTTKSNLPAFLTVEGGLNSGFMIAQVTAAALVSENKVLCHPSSVDSISTSAGQEDHVSMGGWSARKALKVIENVEILLSIELLMACQAIDLLAPWTSTEPLEAVRKLVRASIRKLDQDRFLYPDIQEAQRIVQSGEIWKIVEPFLRKYLDWLHQQEN